MPQAVVDVVIGVDAHKRTHTLVAADELGRELASRTVSSTRDGHLAALAWAQQVAGAPVGAGGLPALDPDAGGRPAARRRARAQGPDPPDGWPASQRPPAGQVGPDRRARGRAGRVARTGAADRPARRTGPRGPALGRSPRRPRRRANPRAKPDPLASA